MMQPQGVVAADSLFVVQFTLLSRILQLTPDAFQLLEEQLLSLPNHLFAPQDIFHSL